MKKGNRGQRSSTTSSKSRESTQTPPLDLFITVPAQCHSGSFPTFLCIFTQRER